MNDRRTSNQDNFPVAVQMGRMFESWVSNGWGTPAYYDAAKAHPDFKDRSYQLINDLATEWTTDRLFDRRQVWADFTNDLGSITRIKQALTEAGYDIGNVSRWIKDESLIPGGCFQLFALTPAEMGFITDVRPGYEMYTNLVASYQQVYRAVKFSRFAPVSLAGMLLVLLKRPDLMPTDLHRRLIIITDPLDFPDENPEYKEYGLHPPIYFRISMYGDGIVRIIAQRNYGAKEIVPDDKIIVSCKCVDLLQS